MSLNISPVEDASRGKIVVDGSIPHPELGLLEEPVELDVSGGSIVSMRGPRDYIEKLDKLFLAAGSQAKILAECGWGWIRQLVVQATCSPTRRCWYNALVSVRMRPWGDERYRISSRFCLS